MKGCTIILIIIQRTNMILLPFQVDFDITLDCMYKCRHCNADAGDKLSDEMNTVEIFNVLDQLDQIGISDVSLTGGEPLLRKDALEIIKYAYDKIGFRLTLNTNGLLLDSDKINFFKKNCPNINIAVSMDGYTPETYSILRKSKCEYDRILNAEFEIVKEHLILLAESGLSSGVNFTITNETIDNVLPTYDFIRKIGIKSMLAIKFFPYGQGRIYRDSLELPNDRWEKFLVDITKLKKADEYYKGVQISVMCPWEMYLPLLKSGHTLEEVHEIWQYNSPLESDLYRRSRDIGCHAGITSCAISLNGDVYPCGTISSKFPPFVCGNLKKSSFEDIWYNSPVLQSLRELKLKNIEGQCQNCDYVDLCGGGCRGRAFCESGDLNGIDYLCPLNC